MKIIGLTGGIASGKSAVSTILKDKYHLPVVDADVLAREAVAPGSPGIAAIAEAFGPGVIAADGSMDREKMGALMRADAGVRARLNAITHPLVEAAYEQAIAAYAAQGEAVVIYDCPLLFEARQEERVDTVLLVTADEATRTSRIMTRDGCDLETARQKIAIQMPEADKMARADAIIYNDGTLENLEACVAHCVRQFMADLN